MIRSSQELADAYYNGWRTGLWKRGQVDIELFDPHHFRFFGAMDQFSNRADFASALVDKVGQHLEFGKIYRQFVDSNDVCTIYDFRIGTDSVPTAEWIHAENGYINEIRLIFDPTRLSGHMRADH